VLDVAPDGRISYIQRGMQRASHRAVDPSPDRTDHTPEGDIFRAWHPHTNTTTALLIPDQPEQLEIEVFPLGWIFRPGHKLVIQVHAPPPADPLSIYAWVSGLPAAVNTVYHAPMDGLAASSILIPVINDPAGVPGALNEPPDCVDIVGVPCFSPQLSDLPSL
jgi:predicted acyl esterase